MHVLKVIDRDYTGTERRFTEMLAKWLQMPDISWQKLLNALVQHTVHQYFLACEIVKEHDVYLQGNDYCGAVILFHFSILYDTQRVFSLFFKSGHNF